MLGSGEDEMDGVGGNDGNDGVGGGEEVDGIVGGNDGNDGVGGEWMLERDEVVEKLRLWWVGGEKVKEGEENESYGDGVVEGEVKLIGEAGTGV